MRSITLLWIAACVALAGAPAVGQKAAPTLWPAMPATATVPLDELISVGMTRPIPMQKAPAGCAVRHTERYCRDDKQAIRAYNVLEQRTSATSTVDKISIDKGCVVVEMNLAVPIATGGGNMCEGGVAKVYLKLQVSAR